MPSVRVRSASKMGLGLALALVGGVSALAVAGEASAQAAGPAAPAAAPAGAASLGDVVVTARRVKESVQKVPIAVTVMDKTAVRDLAIVNPIEVQFHAPSIQMQTSFGRLVGGFAVRGIANGTTSYFAEVPGGPTAIPSASLYDVASIQVLNGPQGTLFGRTNIAGAVLTEPARPQFNNFNGFIDITGGNLGLNQDTAVVNVPVIPDQLAVRIAVNRRHLDGYTDVLGSDEKLNETNNYGGRFSVNWAPGNGKFTDYAVLDYFGANESSGGYVLSAYNPNIALFHLPTSINAPGGMAAGTAHFGGVCASAVAAGIQSNLNDCINQRLQIAASFLPALQSELARTTAGGNQSLRATEPLDAGVAASEFMNLITFVNQAQYDFGNIGFTTLSIKNIFGLQETNGSAGWEIDGIGGSLFSALSGASGPFFYSNAGNQVSHLNGQATGVFTNSPYVPLYTDETQVRGVIGHDLLSWNLGAYFQTTQLPTNLSGIQNIARTFGGVNLPTLGFTPSFSFQNGGSVNEKAGYGQATLNLGWLTPFISGLHLTAGGRYTWDDSSIRFISPVTNVSTGQLVPGAPAPTAISKSAGLNTTLALDAQVTDHLLLYATTRTAYVPGGSNTVLAAQGLPNFEANYDPENVTDYEFGVKADFRIGNAAARIDADIYRNDFTNIQETFFGAVNGVTATYVGNAAAAQIQGFELQGQLAAGDWDFSLVYSYADAKFTKWIGTDPLGLILPGDARCLSSSGPGVCLLNLANSAFPNIPQHQGSLSVKYTLPLDPSIGTVSFLATGYYQTQTYFSTAATRNIQAFGPLIGTAEVRNSQGQAPYGRVNLRAEWRNVYGSPVSIAAFANNLTDYNYAISSVSVLQSLGTAVNLYGEPRTFGVELRYQFGH